MCTPNHFFFAFNKCFHNQVVLPFYKQKKLALEAEKEAKRGKSADELFMMEPITAVEEQYATLDPYDIRDNLFADYLEMMIQFGYCTLFSAAFVLAPVLGFVNNYLEIRVDAWKITSLCRRPFPKPAEDIGTWQTVRSKLLICRNDIHSLANLMSLSISLSNLCAY